MTTPTTLRRNVAALATLAAADLTALWDQVATQAEARQALEDVLPALVETYGAASAFVASEWYDSLRAKADAPGSFRAFPAEVPDPGAQQLAGWATRTGKDLTTTKTLVEGSVQRRIANASRITVMQSSAADPATVGWKRIGAGSCGFCRMLIERDATYTQATADFGSHDNCNCQAYPLIKGAEPIDVKDYVKSSAYIEDEAKRAAKNARTREWVKTNLPEGPAIPRF